MAAVSPLEELAGDLLITEERQQAIDLNRRRLVVDHSLVLHRDACSAADVLSMISHLQKAGMPDTADLKVDGPSGHTRMCARWSTDLDAD